MAFSLFKFEVFSIVTYCNRFFDQAVNHKFTFRYSFFFGILSQYQFSMNVPRYLDFQTVGCPWKTWAKGLESALSRSMRNSAAAHNLQPPYHLPTRHSFHCCHHGTQVASCQESQCDLLEQLVRFDPNKRPSACEALRHPYLDDLHDEDDARFASWGCRCIMGPLELPLPNSRGWARCFKSCGLELWWGNWSRWFAATWLPQ